MPRKVYISGPMTGLPGYNRPAFHAAARRLAALGHVPLNPALLPEGLEYDEYLAVDLAMVAIADTILLLPGWENSTGAAYELEAATHCDIWTGLTPAEKETP